MNYISINYMGEGLSPKGYEEFIIRHEAYAKVISQMDKVELSELEMSIIEENKSRIEMNEVLDLINKGEVEYFDRSSKTNQQLQGYIVFNNEHVCPLFTNGEQFGLNILTVDKFSNTLHLSRRSIFGSITPGVYNYSMEQAIEAYNNKARERHSSKFKLITDYKIF